MLASHSEKATLCLVLCLNWTVCVGVHVCVGQDWENIEKYGSLSIMLEFKLN